MNTSLEIIVNDQGDKHYLHLGETNTVGRSSENRIQITAPFISTNHAIISLYDDGQYVVEDLGSRNGTFINGVQIDGPTYIGHGDTLRFGLAACRVVETPADALGVSSPTSSDSAKGVGAAVAGMAVAGSAVAAGAVTGAAGSTMSLGGSGYQPALASTVPVAWQFGDDYKPGLLTSYPFVEKVKEKKAAVAKAQAAKPKKEYYPKRKKKSYDPFASAY